MPEVRENISHNLIALRKKRGLTQSELAKELGYSDKSISKWEHGEAFPNIETFQRICDYYGITLDFLTHEQLFAQTSEPDHAAKRTQISKRIIAGLSIILVWIVAGVVALAVYVMTDVFYWMAFVWAVPLSFIVCIIFVFHWGARIMLPALFSLFAWTLLAAMYCELGLDLPNGQGWGLWMIFFIGIPATLAAVIWSRIKHAPSKNPNG